MVRTLYLLRHAKSSWDDETLADFDRPLSARGRRDAQRMAEYVSSSSLGVEMVLCSPAQRVKETLEPLVPALGDRVEVRSDGDLYEAGAGEILQQIAHLPPGVRRVLVVGHNPGLQDLALALCGRGDPSVKRRLTEKFPTGAIATLVFDADWDRLGLGDAELTSLVAPGDLSARPAER